ncbi:SDR family NAD(P)-dependent oxidoreductase [Pseudomonas putida]|uniref:SDR family NAD(P)-dependent oxidoreductase n=1 Tax=Pseudomonas putida TaxID=303 RepID=A0A6I6Y9B3_PSEPU|nr:SDR family NAD(P)-dependent oxidoreductase [Pseudomonas putida]QHG68199.1 SDR family NAD(P)-dependent oxidoreductase [Pseudomonas putida]
MSKSVLVTGAATGLGRGVAWTLAERGHKVIAGCQIWPQVWELRNAAMAAGVQMQVIKLDVLNEIDRKHALAIEIDVLFNNAGIMESGPVVEIPMSVFRSVFNPGAYRTGFNDTGMQTMDQWWSLGDRIVAHWPLRELDRQHDPAEMINAIAAVIEEDKPAYRTVRPASAEAMVKKEQSDVWSRRV